MGLDQHELRRLADMPLSQKYRQRIQSKCKHGEIYSSTVTSGSGSFTTRICLDCHKTWRIEPIYFDAGDM